jgi:hypothetical protein
MKIDTRPLIFEQLNTEHLAQYKALTPSRYHCCFLQEDPDNIPDTSIVAIETLVDGNPAAILIVSLYELLHLADIHVLAIADPFLSLNLTPALIAALQKELLLRKCRTLMFVYSKEMAEKLDLSKVLKELSWEGDNLFEIKASYACQDFHPSWFEQEKAIPPGWEIFFWKDLTTKEKEKLLLRQQHFSFPRAISPFGKKEALIEPLNSLGLRYHGEVVGWMITHRIKPDTLLYSSLYVDQEHRASGMGIQLVRTAVKQQQSSSIPFSLFEINVRQIDSSWLHFVKRRLLPYALRVDYTRQAWKHFNQL